MTTTRHSYRPDVPAWLDRQAAIAGRLLVVGLALAAVMWLALRVQFISTAVVLGFAEVSLLWPLVRWLRAHRVPQPVAAILCVLAFLAFFTSLMVFVVAEVVRSGPDLADAAVGAFDDIVAWVRTGPFGVDSEAVQNVLDELQSSVGSFIGGIGTGVATGLSVVGNVLTVLLIATFFAVFALSSGDKLWGQFVRALPEDRRQPATTAFRASMRAAGNWFYASTLTGLVDGLIIGIGLWLLRRPSVRADRGADVRACVHPVGGCGHRGGRRRPGRAVRRRMDDRAVDAASRPRVQQIEGNVLSPLLLSRALNFHPLILLILTTAAASAFGLVGLFLAIPVTGAITAAVIAYRRALAGVDTGTMTPMEV